MMKTAKDLELSLLLKEKTIQDLKLKIDNLEDELIGVQTERDVLHSKLLDLKANLKGIKNYVQNNREYVDDIMKQYFDMILYIAKMGE